MLFNWRRGLFPFWSHKILPLVYDESLSYYEVLCKLVDYVNYLREDVNHITEMFGEPVDIEKIVEEEMANAPKTLAGNVILNMKIDTGYSMNGGCYIGNGKMCVYMAHDQGSSASDTGMLQCYDLSSYSKLWEYPIKGYHGNSLTYHNGRVYICGCNTVADTSALINNIVIVNLANPSAVEREVALAVTGEGCYSLTYADGKFYAMTNRGAIEGVSNLVNIFDENLNYVGDLYLPDFTIGSTQGIHCFGNGNLYAVGHSTPLIYGYNLEDKKMIMKAPIAEVFNGYKFIGEAEFLAYDWDTDSYILGGMNSNAGEVGTRFPYLAELGMFKNIYCRKVIGQYINNRSGLGSAYYHVRFDNFSGKPTNTDGQFYTLLDAITAAKQHNGDSVIVVHTGDNDLDFTVEGFDGAIRSTSYDSKLPFTYLKIANSKVSLANIELKGVADYKYQGAGSPWNVKMFISDSVVDMQNVEFTGDDGSDGDVGCAHSWVSVGADVEDSAWDSTASVLCSPTAGVLTVSGSNNVVIQPSE